MQIHPSPSDLTLNYWQQQAHAKRQQARFLVVSSQTCQADADMRSHNSPPHSHNRIKRLPPQRTLRRHRRSWPPLWSPRRARCRRPCRRPTTAQHKSSSTTRCRTQRWVSRSLVGTHSELLVVGAVRPRLAVHEAGIIPRDPPVQVSQAGSQTHDAQCHTPHVRIRQAYDKSEKEKREAVQAKAQVC